MDWLLREVQSLKERDAEEFHQITSALKEFQEDLKQVKLSFSKLEAGQEDIKTMIQTLIARR